MSTTQEEAFLATEHTGLGSCRPLPPVDIVGPISIQAQPEALNAKTLVCHDNSFHPKKHLRVLDINPQILFFSREGRADFEVAVIMKLDFDGRFRAEIDVAAFLRFQRGEEVGGLEAESTTGLGWVETQNGKGGMNVMAGRRKDLETHFENIQPYPSRKSLHALQTLRLLDLSPQPGPHFGTTVADFSLDVRRFET
ncbi:hypothetical protein BS47DRAFT_1402219 [Hydnum rufescens UP504]|uniref:Uncharacterized protein n=1 Tax=Hydnum rufescens UP504 TaxID=1448309 RepID=A0A9P6DLW5_9AGAM|nr:hypothetical protein BS47DRAFT_1402219 [Hydnum rufescens UP504]